MSLQSIAALLAAATGCSGVGPSERGGEVLTIKGSDTMIILAQSWAERFTETDERAVVQVSGGGSGTGFAALLNGTTDLANASRAIEEAERAQILETFGEPAVEVRVALDAVTIYVHEENPVPSLSIEELEGVYRGRITRWSELGGRDWPIVLYSRENNSGTYAFFKQVVLEERDFAPETQTLPGTAAVINAVSRDRYGIGYGGIGYAIGVHTVPLRVGDRTIEPGSENAMAGTYPLARPLFVYSVGSPEGAAERYLRFVLSTPGQEVVRGLGFFPLPARERDLDAQLRGGPP